MTHDSSTDTETARADGSVQVVKGPEAGPLLVLLDPSGDAKHDELPATWRPLTEDIGVVWWRLPSARRAGQNGDRLLDELPGDHHRVHLVGVRGAALLTLSLAVRHRELVQSVILVDPPWPEHDLSSVGRIVDDPGLAVRQVWTGTAEERLPVGHPDVVAAVVRELVAADGEPPEDVMSAPGTGPLTHEAWRGLHTTLLRLTGQWGGQQ